MSAHSYDPNRPAPVQSRPENLDATNAFRVDAAGVRRAIPGYAYTEELIQQLRLVPEGDEPIVQADEAGWIDPVEAFHSDEPAESDDDILEADLETLETDVETDVATDSDTVVADSGDEPEGGDKE